MLVKCGNCGEDFNKNPCRVDRKHHFCSRKCYNLFLRNQVKFPLFHKPKEVTPKILIKCDQCGIEFNKKPWAIKHTRHHFCSYACYKEYEKQSVTAVKCDQCGMEYNRRPSRSVDRKHHFCSRKCYNLFLQNQVKPTIKCEQCGTEFYKRAGTRKDKNHYCSQACYHICRNARLKAQPKTLIKCGQCGKSFYVPGWRIKLGLTITCSRKCDAIFKSKVASLQKLGNFPERKEVCVLLAKVKSMFHQEAQTTIKETPR